MIALGSYLLSALLMICEMKPPLNSKRPEYGFHDELSGGCSISLTGYNDSRSFYSSLGSIWEIT